jgi:hypothetical protein
MGAIKYSERAFSVLMAVASGTNRFKASVKKALGAIGSKSINFSTVMI